MTRCGPSVVTLAVSQPTSHHTAHPGSAQIVDALWLFEMENLARNP
jgi:hypothetical protein